MTIVTILALIPAVTVVAIVAIVTVVILMTVVAVIPVITAVTILKVLTVHYALGFLPCSGVSTFCKCLLSNGLSCLVFFVFF